jgi:hypothetical protein
MGWTFRFSIICMEVLRRDLAHAEVIDLTHWSNSGILKSCSEQTLASGHNDKSDRQGPCTQRAYTQQCLPATENDKTVDILQSEKGLERSSGKQTKKSLALVLHSLLHKT